MIVPPGTLPAGDGPGPLSYVVTDIESDGPDPGRHSMLSFGSVAVDRAGRGLGEFAANLMPLPGGEQDPGTMTWWGSEPDAWRETTRDPQDPAAVMRAFADWVRGLPGTPVFVAHPLTFDGLWIDWYLQRFVGNRLFRRPRSPGLCHAGGLDLQSMVMAATGRHYRRCERVHYPAEWLGGHDHSHRAIDDARGYAHLLVLILNGGIAATGEDG